MGIPNNIEHFEALQAETDRLRHEAYRKDLKPEVMNSMLKLEEALAELKEHDIPFFIYTDLLKHKSPGLVFHHMQYEKHETPFTKPAQDERICFLSNFLSCLQRFADQTRGLIHMSAIVAPMSFEQSPRTYYTQSFVEIFKSWLKHYNLY